MLQQEPRLFLNRLGVTIYQHIIGPISTGHMHLDDSVNRHLFQEGYRVEMVICRVNVYIRHVK